MKNMRLIIALIICFIISSCNSDMIDISKESNDLKKLTYKYNVIEAGNDIIRQNEKELVKIEALTIDEADEILSKIISNNNNTITNPNIFYVDNSTEYIYEMNKITNDNIMFSTEIYLSSDTDNLFYNGYDIISSSDKYICEIELFSIESKGETSLKFESSSYLIMKINNIEPKYIKVPFKIRGTLNIKDKTAIYKYIF